MFKKIREALGQTKESREAEYKLYEKVSRDISNGERDEGVWTLAFAKSEGNNQKTEALYIELMVQRYKNQIEENIKKEKLDRETSEAKLREEKTKKIKKDRKIQERKQNEKLIISLKKVSSDRQLKIVTVFATIFLIIGLIAILLVEANPSEKDNASSLNSLEDYSLTEYTSVHKETYWFIEKEVKNQNYYVGSVRSNLVWGDRMSVWIAKSNCGLINPKIFLQLSTNKVQTDYPDFDFSSLEGGTIVLHTDLDGRQLDKIVAEIDYTFDLGNGTNAIVLNLNHVYDLFLAIDPTTRQIRKDVPFGWQFLTIEIDINHPYRKYFYFPKRQYRMSGFSGVVAELIEQCKQDVRAK